MDQVPNLMDIVSSKLRERQEVRGRIGKPIFLLRTLQNYLNTAVLMWMGFGMTSCYLIDNVLKKYSPKSWSGWWWDVQYFLVFGSLSVLMYIRIYYFFFPDNYDDGKWTHDEDCLLKLGPKNESHDIYANFSVTWNKQSIWRHGDATSTDEQIEEKIPEFMTNLFMNLQNELNKSEVDYLPRNNNAMQVYIMTAKLWSLSPPTGNPVVKAKWIQMLTEMGSFLLERERDLVPRN